MFVEHACQDRGTIDSSAGVGAFVDYLLEHHQLQPPTDETTIDSSRPARESGGGRRLTPPPGERE